MEDNPLDQPARTDHHDDNQYDIDNKQEQRIPASGRASPDHIGANSSTSGSAFASANSTQINPSQSSSTSSQTSGAIPIQLEPIANRTRGALRASISGLIEGIETASSASAGSRILDHPSASREASGSGARGKKGALKRRRSSELSALPEDQPTRRTRSGEQPSLTSSAKGKQRAFSESDSDLSLSDIDIDESEAEAESAPKSPKGPAKKRLKRGSRATDPKTSASTSTSASAGREEEVSREEGGSSGKRRMSGKGKAKGQSVAGPKKQPRPPKRERVASGSGNGRRNRGPENDISYEDEDVVMEDPEPSRPRSRKSSTKQAREQELAAASAALGAASSSASAPAANGNARADSDSDSEDQDEEEDAEVKPDAALLAAVRAATGLAGPSSRGVGSAASALAAAASGAGTRELLSALGSMGAMGGLYGYGAYGGGRGEPAEKWKTMLNNLRSPDALIRIAALEKAAEGILMDPEEALSVRFPLEAAIKEFVAILNRKPNIDASATKAAIAEAVTEDDGDDESDDEAAQLRAALAMSREESGVGADFTDNSDNDVRADLYACRCLVNLIESLPASMASIVHGGAVPALCSKLENIASIELAAQAINTLEKIAKEQPAAIVRVGGMLSLLNFIDFFDKYDQRSAVTAVASCCKRLSPEQFPHVKAVFPKLIEVLGAPEPKLVEAACTAIIKTIESYKYKPELLDQLIDKDMVMAMNTLILPSGGGQTLPDSVYTELLKALSVAARASATVTLACIEADLPGSIYFVLTGVLPPAIVPVDGGVCAAPPVDSVIQQNFAQRPKGQVEEALVLLGELLPPTPKHGVFDPRNYSERTLVKYTKAKAMIEREKAKHPEGPAISMEELVKSYSHSSTAPVPTPGQTPEEAMAQALNISIEQYNAVSKAKKESEQAHLAKMDLFQKNVASVSHLIQIILPVLVSVYLAASGVGVRTKVLLALSRAIMFSNADLLRMSLKMVPLAGLLSAIITSEEPDNLTLGMLQITEVLLDKVPDIYVRSFHREGVFQGICALADQSLSPEQQQRSKEAAEKKSSKGEEKGGSGAVTPTGDVLQAEIAAPSVGGISLDLASGSRASGGAIDVHSGSLQAEIAKDLKPNMAMLLASDKAMASLAAARKASSLQDPRDSNIIRCKVLRIKKGLDSVEQESQMESGTAQVIRRLAADLVDSSASRGALSGTLDEMAALFVTSEEPVSSYELVHTGLLEGLLAFASDDRIMSLKDRGRLLYDRFTAVQGHSTNAYSELVTRLQESLSRLEKFDVELPATSVRVSGARVSGDTPLDNLIRHMRVRVIADLESEMPRHYKDMVLTVSALTPVSQLQSYLRARAIGAAGGPGSRAGLAGTFYESYLGGADALRERLLAAEERAAMVGSSNGASSSRADQSKPAKEATATPSASDQSGRRVSARLRGEAPPQAGSVPAPADVSTGSAMTAEPVAEIEDTTREPGHTGDDATLDGDDDYEDEYDDEDIDDDGGPIYEEEIMDEEMDDRPADRTVVLALPEDGKGGKPEAYTPEGTRVATPPVPSPAAPVSKGAEPPTRTGSYAAALRAPPQDWHFQFSINGQEVGNGETIYGAITRRQASQATKASVWDSQPVMRYKRVPGPSPVASVDRAPMEAVTRVMPESFSKDTPTESVLRMLRVLHALEEDLGHTRLDEGHPAVDRKAFVNQKLTAKFIRQLEELLVVLSETLPSWAVELPRSFPFLFTFEARFNYLETTAFGYSRIVNKAIANSPSSTDDRRRNALADLAPRNTRVKVRLARENILFSATRVMELYAPQPGLLEIEYFEEIGTGLGPTLEFYTIVSRALSTKGLGIWRDEDGAGEGEYVRNQRGLFPKPINAEAAASTGDASPLARFTTLGLFAGKALLDSRIIDLNFNKTFMKAVLGHPITADIETLRSVDPALAQSLSKLEVYAEANFSRYGLPGPELLVDGVKIADLGLDFTLPGYPEVVMKPNGAQIDVTGDNVDEYIALVLDFTLVRGIAKQVEAFRQGFSKIFSVSHLSVFTPSELVLLFGDPEEDWTRDTLEKAIKADHGYTSDSPQVRNLIDVMSEFSKEERRAFLQFTTGAPKLPIGGFKGLNPPFTVVHRPHEPPYQADHYLPSVMTCVAYFKLPRYSTKEVIRAQVNKAMHEGAGAFWLS